MSEPGFNAPVHLDVTPRPLSFSPVAADWLRDILPDLPFTVIEKADGVTVPAEAGYYRLTLASGRLLFAKVKVGDRAAKEAKAAALSSLLNQLGAASLAPDRGQIRSENGLSVFVYPWVEEVFYDESIEGITSLGKSLADLHLRMRDLPGQIDTQRHLFDIWEGRLALISNLPFADDYRRLLATVGGSFSREASQIAHNDIHRGNVLFDASEVVAFIDFEDAVETVSSPLVDISASLERFCLLPEPNERCAPFLPAMRIGPEALLQRRHRKLHRSDFAAATTRLLFWSYPERLKIHSGRRRGRNSFLFWRNGRGGNR